MQVGTPKFKMSPHFACALHCDCCSSHVESCGETSWRLHVNSSPRASVLGQLGQHISCLACQGLLSCCFLNQNASKHPRRPDWKLNYFSLLSRRIKQASLGWRLFCFMRPHSQSHLLSARQNTEPGGGNKCWRRPVWGGTADIQSGEFTCVVW